LKEKDMLGIDLRDKVALVGGASRGIGRACAEVLAQAGARLILLSRNPTDLQALKASLPHAEQHHILAVDLSDAAQSSQALQALLQTEKLDVHIWVNNSGGPAPGPAHTASADAYRQAFEQHVVASQMILQVLLPSMRKHQYGRIINIISTSVREPIPNLGVSNTIRAAVANWAKTLSRELAPWGITVNNILPGFTQTERLAQIIQKRAEQAGCTFDEMARQLSAQVPAGRFARPEEIAYAVAFLASPLASYINGVHLAIDGGRLHSA
jgi:3-oxoacyl-[acyl-carrier protein] reductase